MLLLVTIGVILGHKKEAPIEIGADFNPISYEKPLIRRRNASFCCKLFVKSFIYL